MIDTRKLARVLNLTTSPSDGETLAAVRRANALLRSAGLDWSQVLIAPPVDALIPQEVRSPEGVMLRPPVGDSWRATAVWLGRQTYSWDRSQRRRLDALVRDLRGDGGVTGEEAAYLTAAYRLVAGLA